MSDLGKLSRSFRANSNAEINLFKKDDGTSMNAEETLNKLCTVLFPECKSAEEYEPLRVQREAELHTASCSMGASIKDVRSKMGFFDPLPPLCPRYDVTVTT